MGQNIQLEASPQHPVLIYMATAIDAAIAIVLRIQAATDQLSEFPMMGRIGRVDGTRELVIANTPYIVIYRVKGSAVEVLRVLHASRKYPD